MAAPEEADDASAVDLRVPNPFARLVAWLGPPRHYALTRWLILRLLGVVYLFAFLGIIFQGDALLGSHGLTPIGALVEQLRAEGLGFIDVPSVFWWSSSDGAIATWAYLGLALSAIVVLGYANLPMLLGLWCIYGSYERVGGLWFGFGWEIQILETTLLAACLVHPWDPRPLRAPAPPTAAIVLVRWLVFRIMLGAGLIKLRGSACWTELTCLDAHFETQPIPNPLSPLFHHMPQVLQAAGVAVNHLVELALPIFVFGPRRLRLVAGIAMVVFQVMLVASGNLAFLNWLTLVPILACFDDDALLRMIPRRPRAWLVARIPDAPLRDGAQLAVAFGVGLAIVTVGVVAFRIALVLVVIGIAACWVPPARDWLAARFATRRLDRHQLAVGAFAALVTFKSCAVVANLASDQQRMNSTFDRVGLVNTYGAFGRVDMVRHELVIEGTRDADPATATWRPYELPCKPGELTRRPCVLGPYHLRLDWLIWFAAMQEPDETAWAPPPPPGQRERRRENGVWMLHLVWKLLDGDRELRTLFATDPFDGVAPTFIRIRRFVYHLEPFDSATWWTRDHEELWLQPVSLDTEGLAELLARYRWPSPTARQDQPR